MNPALIGVALVILLWASHMADGEEEEERREAAGDGEPQSWSWRSRVGAMAVAILLLPLGLAFHLFPEILIMDAPAWWWAWLSGAGVYVVFLVVAGRKA